MKSLNTSNNESSKTLVKELRKLFLSAGAIGVLISLTLIGLFGENIASLFDGIRRVMKWEILDDVSPWAQLVIAMVALIGFSVWRFLKK